MKATETSVAAQELAWFKSSYSGAEGGECVEVAASSRAVYVRDSKDADGPSFAVAPRAWAGFIEGLLGVE